MKKKKILTARLAVFIPNRWTGNNYSLKAGLSLGSKGLNMFCSNAQMHVNINIEFSFNIRNQHTASDCAVSPWLWSTMASRVATQRCLSSKLSAIRYTLLWERIENIVLDVISSEEGPLPPSRFEDFCSVTH